MVPVVRTSGPEGSVLVGDIGPTTNWANALRGVDCIIHAAARVHVMDGAGPNTLELYRRVNTLGTQRLAEQAVAMGVRRMVFVSSVKVNGERTQPGAPFISSGIPAPEDAYGRSKLEAEQTLKAVADRTGLEVIVVRPSLVYGPGVRANFGQLVRLVRRGVPLPFASVQNRRSLVGLDNLIDLLLCCARHPAAPSHTFMASDGQDLSTPDLIRGLAQAMGRSPRLLPVPVPWLHFGGRMLGQGARLAKLTESLQVDIRLNREVLDWVPRVSVEEGFVRTVTR